MKFARSRILAPPLVLVLSGGCVNGYIVNRDLHYIVDEDGNEQLVRTPSPAPAAYESYLRARLALERAPADLDAAREHALLALRWQPREAQLWVLLAEVEWQTGNLDAAEAALSRALELQPGYTPVENLRGRMAAAPRDSVAP